MPKCMKCGDKTQNTLCENCSRNHTALDKDQHFYVSGKYVRGPSRVGGSGFKELVIELPDAKKAAMTADNLNALIASIRAEANEL